MPPQPEWILVNLKKNLYLSATGLTAKLFVKILT